MKFDKSTFNELLSENYDKPSKSNCKVAVCKMNFINICETNGDLKLKEIVDNVDVYDYDGSSFYMVKDNKANLIYESIAFDNINDFIQYMIDTGDVVEDQIDDTIYNCDADYYVTSNENIL